MQWRWHDQENGCEVMGYWWFVIAGVCLTAYILINRLSKWAYRKRVKGMLDEYQAMVDARDRERDGRETH